MAGMGMVHRGDGRQLRRLEVIAVICRSNNALRAFDGEGGMPDIGDPDLATLHRRQADRRAIRRPGNRPEAGLRHGGQGAGKAAGQGEGGGKQGSAQHREAPFPPDEDGTPRPRVNACPPSRCTPRHGCRDTRSTRRHVGLGLPGRVALGCGESMRISREQTGLPPETPACAVDSPPILKPRAGGRIMMAAMAR